jgi:hypothetical protein
LTVLEGCPNLPLGLFGIRIPSGSVMRSISIAVATVFLATAFLSLLPHEADANCRFKGSKGVVCKGDGLGNKKRFSRDPGMAFKKQGQFRGMKNR